MMAAEATSEKPVDVSVTDALLSQTTATTETDAQNDEASIAPLVNGTNPHEETERIKAVAEILDDVVNSAEVSVSGGSDTEASTWRLKDPNHVRTSSTVKKPQSFKSVSVNKTFLGAKNAASATSRSETSSPALTPATPASTPGASASKLKLVAKSGSNLGGASKTLTTNGKVPGAPDGSTVWNRNRPVPAPEPKKFSDEELKKYGIHISERLRPEEGGGTSKWADEEEDDDDWAPDAITWTDGTRVTLENQPTPSTVLAVPVAAPVANVPIPAPAPMLVAEKPKSPAPVATSNSARASPSVKPSVLTTGKSLVLKGAPEKPTLVAKAPTQTSQAKSPWAPLPPVEKASPVLVELPSHQQPSSMRGYPPRDPSYGQNATPLPAKEIAADDFSRGPWRDGPGAGNRELFNSQSGRYEAVHDRRGSRHDINHRHPALLQRPSQQQDMHSPAEPSSAFQTSRSSGQDAMPYGRRRGSSNVSGGSGNIMQRLGKPQEFTSPDQNAPSVDQLSPARLQHAQPWQQRPPPGPTTATAQDVPPPADVPADSTTTTNPSEDEIELQKRLMRERRELAIKRRLEEEAKEEAARKERIRLKLEAMGPAPERKSTKKEEVKEIPFKRDGPPAGIFSKEDLDAAAAERAAPPPTSAEKPEVPVTTPEMKSNIGQSDPVHQGVPQTEPTRPGASSGSQAGASWPEAAQKPADRLQSWSSGSQSGPRNLWAAPGNDRFLGNGTFDADLGQLADSEPAQPASTTSRPTPIGPPRSASQGQGQQQQPRTDVPNRLAPIGPPGSNRSSGQPLNAAGVARRNLWATADIAADDRAIRLEKEKQIEEYRKKLEAQGINPHEAQHTVRDTWRGVDVGPDGKRVSTATMTTQHGERVDHSVGSSWNAPPPPLSHKHNRQDPQNMHQPVYQQDYRQQHDATDAGYNRAPPMGPAASSGGPLGQPRAGSRFFPHTGSRDIRQEEGPSHARSKSPTPPPPTMDGHPAYDGDVERPHVSLPPTRPVVKLPPTASRTVQPVKQAPTPVAQPKPVSFAAAAAAAAAAPTPRPTGAVLPSRGANFGGNIQSAGEIKKQENWQEKINSLVRASHAKPMSVDSSSKYAFDGHANASATVSLPALSPTGSSISESSIITTKEMAEECFDEQEMGSLPLVNLPNDAPSALWPSRAVEPNWHPLQIKYRIDALASESVRFPYEVANHKSVYRILTPGMTEPRTIPAPFTARNRSNPRKPARGSRGSRGGSRGGRDSLGDHQISTGGSDRPERPERTTSRGGRGGYRARSENWSRNSSTLTQPTQS